MPSTMRAEEYQELGRRYYKRQEYAKAIRKFTEGIAVEPSLSLYDHRAAAYDRLENYDAAIRDGRSMIKEDKKNVKGYLRTASVLENAGKSETALAIYKHGMKHVPVADKHFQLLLHLHDKMTRQLSPAKSVDPLTILPVELAEMVLEYLTFRNVVNCMRTSRGWRDYLAKLPRLWLHLDLSGARRPVSKSFINKAVRRSQNRLTRATIHRFQHMEVITNVAKCCKVLADLEILSLPHAMSNTLIEIVKNAPNLKRLVIHPSVSPDTLLRILQYRPSLERVGIKDIIFSRDLQQWQLHGPFPALKILSIESGERRNVPNPSFLRILPETRFLQSLTLTDLSLGNENMAAFASLPLTSLVLRRVMFFNGRLPKFPESLRTLFLEESTTFLFRGVGGTLLYSRLPALTDLRLINFDDLDAETFGELLDRYWDTELGNQEEIELTDTAPLRSLALRGLLFREPDGLFKDTTGVLAQSPRILTPALESLNISQLPCDDAEIEQLLTHDTGLRSIDLSHTQISGASIKMLVDKLPKLETIRADGCRKISGRDALDYARSKGVTVHCSMGEVKGSRTVRYG